MSTWVIWTYEIGCVRRTLQGFLKTVRTALRLYQVKQELIHLV